MHLPQNRIPLALTHSQIRDTWLGTRLFLDGYWVGSLGFNFLGNQGLSTNPQKVKQMQPSFGSLASDARSPPLRKVFGRATGPSLGGE